VSAIVAGVTDLLNSHPDVDQKLPHGAGLAGYTDYAIEIGLLVRAALAHGRVKTVGHGNANESSVLRHIVRAAVLCCLPRGSLHTDMQGQPYIGCAGGRPRGTLLCGQSGSNRYRIEVIQTREQPWCVFQ